MKHLSMWTALGLGVSMCGIFFAACSSGGDSTGGQNGNPNGNGNTPGVDSGGGTTNSGCTGLTVVFSPMYSAYDGTHTFQVPAIVTGVDQTQVTWAASDPSMVQLAPDTDTGGTMITVQKAGTVTITAKGPNGACGQSTLNITQATAQDWTNGNNRYNNGNAIPPRPDGGYPRDAGAYDAADFDAEQFYTLACSNCHGDNSNPNAPFKDVSHTPEQTGGFSDDDLINIFTNGTIPDGGYFDPQVICGTRSSCTFDRAYGIWQRFHNWDMTDDEKKGIVVYLRSLTPESQTGSSNFGGRGPRDGGGGPPPPQGDSGGQPPPSTDAAPE